MSVITRLTTPPPVSVYAPGASTHLSEVTVEAVDRIGNETATQMEQTANAIEGAASKIAADIMADAKEVAGELRDRAKVHREASRAMSQEVSNFCLRMTSARATIRGIESEVKGKVAEASKQVPSGQPDDDGEPSPGFLHTTDAAGRPNGAARE